MLLLGLTLCSLHIHQVYSVERLKREPYASNAVIYDSLCYFSDVHLNRNAHGPAITMNIKQRNGHDISVDMTPTLSHKELVTHNGWPRPDTKKAFSPDAIKAVTDTGMHLVPKGGEVWTPSYSKAETKLLSDIDKGNGCRRNVLKYCKRQTEMCASRSANGLPGVSSHILKVSAENIGHHQKTLDAF